MSDVEQRLKEAEEIIKSIQKMTTISGTDLAIKTTAKDYAKKYLTPKDELFGMWLEYHAWFDGPNSKGENIYYKFREIFADRLNGTKGLDGAISLFGRGTTGWPNESIVGRLKQIKQELENES